MALKLTRDQAITIAKGMARDPSTDDTKSRFPVAKYQEWLEEAYIYHLAILPLSLCRGARQMALFTLPANYNSVFEIFGNDSLSYFTQYGSDVPYTESNVRSHPELCLRVARVSWCGRDCDVVNSDKEFLRGEESSYFKGTVARPRALVAGKWLQVAPVLNYAAGGVFVYIARPLNLDINYTLLLEAEAAHLVAKYVACRKFEVDGEGQAYQMLYREYQEELQNLIKIYGNVGE